MAKHLVLVLGFLLVQVFGEENYQLNLTTNSNSEILINLDGDDWRLKNEEASKQNIFNMVK